MTAYRFRVKYDPDPTSLWRDVVVGANRTIQEFQAAINPAVGLGAGRRWFVGSGEAYWDSDVKYRCPHEREESPGGDPLFPTDRIEKAADTTIGEMTRQVGLEQSERICYLYDYDDEWRFYAILKEVVGDESSRTEPHVVKAKGDPLAHEDPSGESESGGISPEQLRSMLPETAVPVADLRELEERADVVHVVVLRSVETGFGTVCERFAIQFEDGGYVFENFQARWEAVREVDGADKTAEELLGALASAARDWHGDIAELSGAWSGRDFGDAAVEAMHVELDAELERKGYGHL